VPQLGQAKCGRFGWWHCWQSTVVTLPNFQLAARRLRVLLRGVFHFKLATSLSVSKNCRAVARAFARIPVRPADCAESFAIGSASQSHRQRADHALLRQIGYIQAFTGQHVALTERIDFPPV
jgi:hypothetical protein